MSSAEACLALLAILSTGGSVVYLLRHRTREFDSWLVHCRVT